MRLIVLGAESFGREASEIGAVSGYESVEFLDDAQRGKRVLGRRVVGGFPQFTKHVGRRTEFFVAVGTLAVRDRWMKTIAEAGGALATLVHPRAWVSPSARIGPNTMINAGCHIGTNVVMGKGNVLWSSVVVSHDCTVGEHCFFGPTVAIGGYTHIGDQSMFGCGAKLRPCITIGHRVVIGMGAAVSRSVPDDRFVAEGRPPVPIKGQSAEKIFFGPVRTLGKPSRSPRGAGRGGR
jgi:sugar O-acyltransferase (sialic acid O-acetyltransferase NeuD family)